MAEATTEQDRELLQKAIECYLSAIIGFTNCIAEICPDAGVPFRNQWRRLPQRVGFDSSVESLEKSRRTFETSLDSLRDLTGAFLKEGFPVVRQLAENGGRALEIVLERNAANSAHMASLADALAAAADLDAPPELRDQLEHYAEGLRAGARRVETEMIPALSEMQRLVHSCQTLVETTRQANITDPATELFNERGFLLEIEHQLRRGPVCVVVVDLEAQDSAGNPLDQRILDKLHQSIAPRVVEPFRAFDSIARVGPARYVVIFAGTPAQAQGRSQGIARSISGQYAGATGKAIVTAKLQVLEVTAIEDAQSLVEHFSDALITSGYRS